MAESEEEARKKVEALYEKRCVDWHDEEITDIQAEVEESNENV